MAQSNRLHRVLLEALLPGESVGLEKEELLGIPMLRAATGTLPMLIGQML